MRQTQMKDMCTALLMKGALSLMTSVPTESKKRDHYRELTVEDYLK